MRKDKEFVFIKVPLGTSNQHMIEKIAVISEKSDSSFESESSGSSVDMSEDEEPGSCHHSQRASQKFSNRNGSRLIYLMVPQSALNSNGSFVNSSLHNALL